MGGYSWKDYYYELQRDGEWYECKNESDVVEQFGRVVFIFSNSKSYVKYITPADIEKKELQGISPYTAKRVMFSYKCIRSKFFSF